MGHLAAGILHEVANPIARLGSNLVFVRSRLDDLPHEHLRLSQQDLAKMLGVDPKTLRSRLKEMAGS